MSEFTEDRVYARHRRRTGAVLIVGAGAVGGFLAEELARLGISPIRLVDFDKLEVENLVRHTLGAVAVGQPKASALASKICRDFPVCNATGLDANFLGLPQDEQLRLVSGVDVVVAATDTVECQRRVNEVCLAAEQTAVYPAVWVDQRVRDAEVGEILWVLPGRHTPCYLCATAWRQGGGDAEARGGTRADIQVLVLATAQVVAGLLDRTDTPAGLLDPEQTCIYVHGFSPPSPGVRNAFQGPGLQSRSVHVPFPRTPCPACGGQEPPVMAPRVGTVARPRARPIPPPPFETEGLRQPPGTAIDQRRRTRIVQVSAGVAVCALLLAVAISLAIHSLGSSQATGGASAPPGSSSTSTPTMLPSQANPAVANSAHAIPPTDAQLICNQSDTSSYASDGSDCTSGNMYSGDTIALEVSGITASVASSLCQRGYTDQWSTSMGNGDPGTTGMCQALSDGMWESGDLEAGFSNPNELGTDTVTWQLLSPSGQVVLEAKYSFDVRETLYSSLPTPPS